MSFNFDFSNDKPDIRNVIPAGTPLFLQMTYTPGGAGPEGALTESKDTDAVYLKSEFTVLRGPFKGRKFWSNMTCMGGKLDEKGQSIAGGITRKTVRLMLDSAFGLKSNDDSPEAAAQRVLPNGFKSLQGIRFVARAKVEKAQNGYPEKNGLGQVLTVDMKNYPTEAELDSPTLAAGASATPPTPPPKWAPGSVGDGAATTISPTTAQQNAAGAPPASITGAQIVPPPADNGLPKWAQAA